MKRYCFFIFYLLIRLLVSCSCVSTAINPYAIIDCREEILVPGETVDVYVLDRDEINADDWRKAFGFTVAALIFENNSVKCHYSCKIGAEEIRRISDDESIYKVPFHISFGLGNTLLHTGYMYDCLMKKRIIYPTKAELSKSEAHIGDKISVSCTKPIFDVETFSQDKIKQLEEIGYCPIFVKTYGDIHARVAIPISECVVADEYHISFYVPSDAVSGQILILNEGGVQDLLPAHLKNIEELRTKYINFSSTNCEKYAYYASKTELVILDASDDRVD